MLISVPTPCSSRASQYMAHVMLVVVFWKKLRHDILSTGFERERSYPSIVHIPRRRRTQIHACCSCRCGREVIQHSDFSVSVRCTTEKIEPVRHDPKGRKQLDLARDHEIAQVRSVVGSLAWVARQCRPQISYGVNKLQSVCGTATLDDL